jgi:hypothetical protein
MSTWAPGPHSQTYWGRTGHRKNKTPNKRISNWVSLLRSSNHWFWFQQKRA